MAIAASTVTQVKALDSALIAATKQLEVYSSDSRNPALTTLVDTQLAALKTVLDATIARTA